VERLQFLCLLQFPTATKERTISCPPEGDHRRSEGRMRIAPLWGLRSRNKKLHDGRARTA